MQTGKTGMGVLPLPCRIAQEEFDSARTMDMATEVWWVPGSMFVHDIRADEIEDFRGFA